MTSPLLVRLGRCVIIATQAAMSVFFLLFFLDSAYFLITGRGRLQIPPPWHDVVFYVVIIPWIAVVISWMSFCVGYAVFLRRREEANSLKQMLEIVAVLVPVWGVRRYDRTIRRRATSDGA